MKIFAIVSAAIAFLFCLAGGLVVLQSIGYDLFNKENGLAAGIGLYFVGKAVFVGATIVLAYYKLGDKGPDKVA